MKRDGRMLRTPVLLTITLLLAGLPALAQSDNDLVYGDDYEQGDFGRVRYQENGVTIQRAAVDPGAPPISEAGINAPVFPGDTIPTGLDQRIEVQLAGGSMVRVDRASEITFLALPDPYADFRDNTILQLVAGTIQISSYLGEEEEFRVDTPSCSVYLLGDGDFRIETSPQGRTRVTSHRGVAEVVGEGGSVLLRAGSLTDVYPASFPSTPEPFNTFMADSFDRWVSERNRLRDGYGDGYEYSAEVYDELPSEVRPYYGELSGHGRWIYTADYGYVWHPSGVEDTWRPYYNGYWDYGPHGYFWVSNEPWGWAPYHYGRWTWVSGYGWGWIPGRIFAGAWVAWSWGSLYVGWAPLGYWNYPVYVGVSHYYHYDPYCWTFISYNHIYYRDYPRYAVPVSHVGSRLARTAVVTRPPRVSPRQLAQSPEWRGRAARRAETDHRARIKPTYRERRPDRNLRDVDSAIARRNPTRPEERANRPGPGRGSPVPRQADSTPRTSPRDSRRGLEGRTELGANTDSVRGGRLKNYPRRLTTEGAEGSRGRSDATRRSTRRSPGSRASSSDPARERSGSSDEPTRARPRQSTEGQSAERVRDLYRQMSGARTTRERTGSSVQPRSSGRSGSSESQPRATPRSSGSSRSGGSSATPRSSGSSRSGGSSAKPRSSGSSRSGGSSAKPRSSGSRSSGSSAKPRSGGSSGKSGSRSGGKKRGG